MTGGHTLLGDWARAAPERTALVQGDRCLTYSQLDAASDRLARDLRAAGAGDESVVGLHLDRSVELVIAVLGIWKAGAAYTPLVGDDPRSRRMTVLSDTGCSLMVVAQEHVDPDLAAKLRVLDVRKPCSAEPYHHGDVSGDQLAYVLYTSGSTGAPKGALVEHRGVVNLARALAEEFGDLDGARVFQFAPVTFDAWVWELAMSVLNGGTLCIPETRGELSGAELARQLRLYDTTHLSAAASLLRSLPVEDPPPVRTLVSGGEPLARELVERWADRVRVFNAYGPTEVTVGATLARCFPGEPKPAIGRPLRGVAVRLLDEAGAPVPPGAAGEIHLGGVQVARGYLARPELTAERFHAGPDGDPPGRWFRTGDLAVWRPDGQLDFVGRADRQLNVHGFRIEPVEVEHALCRHPRVTAAAVTSRSDADGAQQLVAYLHTPGGEQLPVPELRRVARETLPAHMVPSVYVAVAGLPLTAHGKVDHSALPEPGSQRPPLGYDFVPPRGETEERMARLWERLLGVTGIGADDEFADLGGTSMHLVQLRKEIQQLWGVPLPLRDLSRTRTVRRLSAHLDSTEPTASEQTASNGPAIRAARRGVTARIRTRRQSGPDS
ncbi:amino acid adenylation domain-containing protein [Haloactinospora alba]|uniref:Amino acid adenylation domain-containing protein n=1 Tax=Haloactinospora alba TaxID=405555 RepID=A0A543NEM0_9ACTN|nr:non-ribosomal peptide synthetase [Haloactinospora alba]TQN30294.1 amino acid adenylation domain-containing protein [Haloactinospora alba]